MSASKLIRSLTSYYCICLESGGTHPPRGTTHARTRRVQSYASRVRPDATGCSPMHPGCDPVPPEGKPLPPACRPALSPGISRDSQHYLAKLRSASIGGADWVLYDNGLNGRDAQGDRCRCNPVHPRLQPYASRLQPYASRLQPYASRLQPYASRRPAAPAATATLSQLRSEHHGLCGPIEAAGAQG